MLRPADPADSVASATAAGGGSAAAKSMAVMKPLHPVVVPPVEPEPKEAKLVGPMVREFHVFLLLLLLLLCGRLIVSGLFYGHRKRWFLI